MDFPQLNLDQQTGSVVLLKTSMGEIKIRLFDQICPQTTENFISLVQRNYYDGTIFHRVINDFMIQGGDPTGSGRGGQSIWQHPFKDEFSRKLYNLRGALSMANAGPNTNGSQFFIMQNKHLPKRFSKQMQAERYPQEIISAYQNGGAPWLDGHHTVFGQVMAGMDVVDRIAASQTDFMDKPVDEIVIETAKLV